MLESVHFGKDDNFGLLACKEVTDGKLSRETG